ncbi:eukaryotic translation initiation factor 4 gamma 3-like isoform X2 [Centruroides vittatus]|uniref:eukaryotic translation initiation factor 4 gamma 3-like isoform X2 n=1 Tax=Centruroides vittatus TaxID=120091 RepID=UPI003510700C
MSLPKGKYIPLSHTIPQQQRVPQNLPNRGQVPQRPEDFSRQIGSYPQQASSFFFILGSEHQTLRQLATGPVPSITNCNPHDMSKQSPLSSPATPTSGLYPSAQAPGPQSGLSGPNPNPGTLQQPQGQHMPARPLGNMMYYNPRPNTPRATHPMALPSALNVGSANASPGTSQFAGQVPGIICAPPPIPFATSLPPQPHLFVGSAAAAVPVSYTAQRPQYGPSAQYAVTTTQPHMYLPSGTPSFLPNPAHQSVNVYYSQMQIPVATANRPSLTNLGQNNSAAFKKERKLIRIQEPGTFRDITEDIMSAGSSGYSSARGTSPVDSGHQDNHIAAMFAAQVAALANGTSIKSSLQNVSVNLEQASLVNNVIVEQQETDSNNRLSESDDFIETNVILNENGPPDNRIDTIEEIKKEIDRPNVETNVSMMAQVIDCVGPEKCVCDKSELIPDSQSTSSVDIELCRSNLIINTNKMLEPHNELQMNENFDEYIDEISLSNKSSRRIDEREIIEKSPGLNREIYENKSNTLQFIETQSDIDEKQKCVSPQNGEIAGEATTNEVKEVVEAKNKKNNKNKKRLKELNKKGESKEGGDMDAFLDKEDVSESDKELIQINITAAKILSPPIVQNTDATDNRTNEPRIEEVKSQTSEREDTQENDETYEEASEELIPVADNKLLQITLKYNYTEDQWSPLNREGKKQYDRSFLLQLQDDPLSLKKPTGLPELEVVKEKAIQHKLPDINRSPLMPLHARNHPDPFIPNYATRTGISRLPSGALNRRQSQPCRDNRPKKIINISNSLSQDVKLHECEKAWKPSHKKVLSEGEDYKTQELLKKIRGILNKLTPQKFHSLIEQVKSLSINTEEKLKGVIDLIFEKAIDEPNFSVSYANMCKHLALVKVPLAGQEGQVNFRKLLLTKCQREFEKDVNDEVKREERLKEIDNAETDEKKRQLQEELEEEERTARRRSLGNIRFIGELFKLNMLTSPIMHDCIKKLLHNQGDEDSLECLCRLLTTIGKELDQEKNKMNREWMDSYFESMQKIVNERRTNSRVRFMLQDVIELRKRNWVPRRDENNPKTIDQIHREAEKEAQEQQLLLQHAAPPKRSDDRERRKSRTGNPYSEEWTPVNKQSRNFVDPSKIKITKLSTEVENLQFGPGGRGFSNWGRGSSGGNKLPSQESETKSTGTNRPSASNRDSSRGRGNQYSSTSIRQTPSPTSFKEREQVLAAVKDITKVSTSEERQTTIQENNQPKEVNDQGLLLRGDDISMEEMENKTKPLIDEFLHIGDFKEATQCVLEIASENSVHHFIMAAVNQVLERSNQARNMVGQLLQDLVIKKIITIDHYIKGFMPILEMAEDSAIDIPRFWEYLGEMIAPMIQDGTVPLTFLKKIAAPCIVSGTAGKLVANILQAAAKKLGSKVGELWRAAGLQWTDFLGPNEDVKKFIQDNKLEFTVQTEPEPTSVLSISEIKGELDFLLQKKCVNNEQIFDWIEANVGGKRMKEPQFVRALVTSVMENAIDGRNKLIEDKVHERVDLLNRYLDHKEHLELQAVYALQALMNQLSHPKDVLRIMFDLLYDEELISEDAFTQWEQSTDPAEQEGKGVALKSVSSFFSWLKQADGEDFSEEN